MGAAVSHSEVAFGVSYNNQDFMPLEEAGAFLYGRPAVKSASPRSGVPGATTIVRGDLLPFTLGLDSTGGYRCKYEHLLREKYIDDPWAALFDPEATSDRGWTLAPAGQSIFKSIDADFSDEDDDEYLLCEVLTMPHGRYAWTLTPGAFCISDHLLRCTRCHTFTLCRPRPPVCTVFSWSCHCMMPIGVPTACSSLRWETGQRSFCRYHVQHLCIRT
jgi:hypothetical protein